MIIVVCADEMFRSARCKKQRPKHSRYDLWQTLMVFLKTDGVAQCASKPREIVPRLQERQTPCRPWQFLKTLGNLVLGEIENLDAVFEVLEDWNRVLEHPDYLQYRPLLRAPKGPTP